MIQTLLFNTEECILPFYCYCCAIIRVNCAQTLFYQATLFH